MDTFIKQPAEVIDYDVDYSDFLSASATTLSSAATSVTAGITVVSTTVDNVHGYVRVRLSGGTDGTTYKITVDATCADAQVKEHDFQVKVKVI
jgi:hypothetical protein